MDMAKVSPTAVVALRVMVNGQPRNTGARTLAELVDEAGFSGMRIATAVNGDFVSERARASRELADGDQIEIVSPRQGG
jgi:sulfur carrier protein